MEVRKALAKAADSELIKIHMLRHTRELLGFVKPTPLTAFDDLPIRGRIRKHREVAQDKAWTTAGWIGGILVDAALIIERESHLTPLRLVAAIGTVGMTAYTGSQSRSHLHESRTLEIPADDPIL